MHNLGRISNLDNRRSVGAVWLERLEKVRIGGIEQWVSDISQ
jgi:hypothetical protein